MQGRQTSIRYNCSWNSASAEQRVEINYFSLRRSRRRVENKKRVKGMAVKASSVLDIFIRFKPHFLMVICQITGTFLFFITEASFNHGMNPHVYITYRHIIASIVLFPLAYFLERNRRPKLTLALFMEIFVLSFLAIGFSFNAYFASLTYTSPTFVVSVMNTQSALTFVIAIVLRLEIINLRDIRSIAKVLGAVASLTGITIMTVYKGPIMRNLWHPLIHIHRNTRIHEQWLKGSVLAVASCISWSIGYIIQAKTLKRYPTRLSLATWMCFLGGLQSALFTAIVEHKSASWRIGFNIDLWSTLYGGMVVSSLNIFVQLWCTEKRGPVFVTVFNPVSTILTAILAYFVFGERLYLGSIIGAVIVIIGLYMLLWGKEGDLKVHIKGGGEQSYPTCDEARDLNLKKITSAENYVPEGEP
ncbi:WAT1-related protein [Melia azedarach]|uniref:WAT1-related protein n=1 Tax=Melia azedarach TaxID=155640 RepID=A0ACC1YI16_MELAZ|nr:WAT1-related protein [Melia azedarach]